MSKPEVSLLHLCTVLAPTPYTLSGLENGQPLHTRVSSCSGQTLCCTDLFRSSDTMHVCLLQMSVSYKPTDTMPNTPSIHLEILVVARSATVYHRGNTYPVSPIPDTVLLQPGATKYNVKKLREIDKTWFQWHKGIRREGFWIAHYVGFLLISLGAGGLITTYLSTSKLWDHCIMANWSSSRPETFCIC